MVTPCSSWMVIFWRFTASVGFDSDIGNLPNPRKVHQILLRADQEDIEKTHWNSLSLSTAKCSECKQTWLQPEKASKIFDANFCQSTFILCRMFAKQTFCKGCFSSSAVKKWQVHYTLTTTWVGQGSQMNTFKQRDGSAIILLW